MLDQETQKLADFGVVPPTWHQVPRVSSLGHNH